MTKEAEAFRMRAYQLGLIIDPETWVEYQTAGLILPQGAIRTINDPLVIKSLMTLAKKLSPSEADEFFMLATPVDELMSQELVIWRQRPWHNIGNQRWIQLSKI